MVKTPFYGGTLLPSGRVSRNPQPGTQFRTEVFLEKLVRFDLAKAQGVSLLSDNDLARVLGRSARYIGAVRTKTSYLRKRMEVTTGISLDSETSVKNSIEKHRQILTMLMPDAFRVLADQLKQRPTNSVEKRLQTTVALEVLDRQGSFPKISRTDSHVKLEHDFASADGVSRELLEALEGSPQGDAASSYIQRALEANSSFSNSETLAPEAQEAALATLEAMPSATEKIQ